MRLVREGLEFHVYTINKSAHTKKVWKLIEGTSYHKSSMGLDMQNASSWQRNPPNLTLLLVPKGSATSVTYISSGIIMNFVLAFLCLHFTFTVTGVLNSIECHILNFDPAVNRETGASGRRYQDITLTGSNATLTGSR